VRDEPAHGLRDAEKAAVAEDGDPDPRQGEHAVLGLTHEAREKDLRRIGERRAADADCEHRERRALGASERVPVRQ
jgi:hypothetical protein